MEDTLSNQLTKLFADIEKLQLLGQQLSLHMWIEDATDDTTALFTDLMMLIQGIQLPEMDFIFEDFNEMIMNKEEMPSA
jgi:hypothetical protein|tara:strand:+ start:1450 stop:1686 length:237 start_codon:yes stop_codon:yes gene_type:complete